MKKLLLFLVASAMTMTMFAQSKKNDIILKLNGDELIGKITEITDDAIKFVYEGETLVYTVKKIDVLKITFASGRIEVINKQPLPSQTEPASGGNPPAGTSAKNTGGNMASHHNKVAILPMAFIKDGQPTADVLSEKVQTEAHALLAQHAGVFTILDPRTTNALLIKAGVTKDNIKGFTMEDICNILGVEYVVDGIVSVNRGTQTNFGSASGNVKTNGNVWSDNNSKTKVNSFSSSTSTQNYETTLELSIYNDRGESVYNQERKAFLNTQDAYRATLQYILKRCPLYAK